ncbi:BfmA/BtgA family mobilization protein [Saccharicrinis aurantiacus]|uniref:BfmA/BtgA family mobilization protein n=1 Tax=Saccharicrinis aurantiacus TaxID=1849719 RepID=UPI0024926D27|nr:BfmA/BtgA family mobilization protein [Saccharicrinis aurantiacus]
MAHTVTTTNIGSQERAALKRLATKHGLKQVEFINHAIQYFKKTGINPADEIFSPREEIAKLTKRVDQVIQFIKTNESKKLNPLLDHMTIISRKLEGQLSNTVTKKDFSDLSSSISNMIDVNIENQEIIFQKIKGNINLEELNQKSLNELKIEVDQLMKMMQIFYQSFSNKSLMGVGFKKEDIAKFNNVKNTSDAIH